MQVNTSEQRALLRHQIRQRRRALSTDQQQLASEHLLQRFKAADSIKQASNIALYLSVDGELDTHLLIEHCWQLGQSVYLPVIHPFSKGHLLFLHYHPDTKLVLNQYGIPEPKLDVRDVLPASKIDVICTPLVAFDDAGQRLGMGGGYYDRTLVPWYKTGEGARPIGLAHDCQQVDSLPVEVWDIPLPEILTPSRHWSWAIV
ncbi:5-formyltetrahydrofolate cyclo-ligase [Enterovibrio nigricans]|uniref:5-formyltetrahydrofolate cyclo-ligase n=1 Tax=Enterovibrio nigricans DSM 22720 TaxID=1121868 RepID=A0A1T4TZN4_9GAMM|nr:5-formyltetrahydrofolate cyclo-ligase [Enterovibrio nigricans]PKF51670.1 5-formyltetrahydrofolate cyclo-ligase [Enterovibrio nigricans]SKA45761.1 5-formyltetrahydrofolate cyclo-ligase [Enterovibrio nigricans DSM 22720]